MSSSLPEPWLRGPLSGVPAVLAPVLRCFEQTKEDLARFTEGLSRDQVWLRRGNIAPLGFQLKHIAGSVDRLTSYLMGRALTPEQMEFLKKEDEQDGSLTDLLERIEAALDRAGREVLSIDPARIEEERAVGRKGLPTTVAGLLTHIAEHTQRHLGEAIITAKLARWDPRISPES